MKLLVSFAQTGGKYMILSTIQLLWMALVSSLLLLLLLTTPGQIADYNHLDCLENFESWDLNRRPGHENRRHLSRRPAHYYH